MRERCGWLLSFSVAMVMLAGALPAAADDWVEIVRVRPESGVIRGVTDGEVSNRPGEFLEITVRYNLESDCPWSQGAGWIDGYWGIGDVSLPLPFDILPDPTTSSQIEVIERTGRGQVRFRWSFQCRADSPGTIDGYVWNLGASLACSTGELDYVEPLLGLDYWTIDCS